MRNELGEPDVAVAENSPDAGRGYVVMFPGQGSQFVGMGEDFYNVSGDVKRIFQLAGELAAKDITKLCFKGPISKLSQTDNLQLAITAVNVGLYSELIRNGFPTPAVCLGHSVGEYSALYASGVLTLEDVLLTALERGRLMQREAKKYKGGMYAVKDLPAADIEALIVELGFEGKVNIANDNSARQQVVSGEKAACQALVNHLYSRQVESVKLPVSGAWHSDLMRGCGEEFGRLLGAMEFKAPTVALLTNVTADYARSPEEIRDNLVLHLTGGVRWQASIKKLLGEGYTRFVEVGPKRVLSKLVAAIAEDYLGTQSSVVDYTADSIETHTIETVQDMDAFLSLA